MDYPETEPETDTEFVVPTDKHLQAVLSLDAKLLRLSLRLRPQWRETCRLAATGLTPAQIAEKQGISAATAAKTLERPDCQPYLAALQSRNAFLAGPTIEKRLQMLWRVAQNNEDKDPRVAIQAVDVLNKATGEYAKHTQKDGGEGGINLTVINNFNGDAAPAPPRDVPGEVVPDQPDNFLPVTVDTDAL